MLSTYCGTQRQTLSLSYGRCIAEFLNEGSPEHLGLLDPTTCVGLRYGRQYLLIQLLFQSVWLAQISALLPISFVFHLYLMVQTTHLDGYSHKSAHATTLRHTGEQYCRYRNINLLSIAYATRLGLGPTNPGTINVAQETLVLRWARFSLAFQLLIPAFSLVRAPPNLTVRLQCPYNAPLPLCIKNTKFASSVHSLAPLYFPRKITIDQ